MADNNDETGTFYPKGIAADGCTMGTLVRPDGSKANVGVTVAPEEDADGHMSCNHDGTFAVKLKEGRGNRVGYTPAYAAGWDRIFGNKDIPEG